MRTTPNETRLSLQQIHSGQLAAHWALKPHRFKALRCGQRFGKTEYGKIWIAQALIQGWECAWFAPQHKTWSETCSELDDLLRPIKKDGSKGSGVLRLTSALPALGREIGLVSRRRMVGPAGSPGRSKLGGKGQRHG